MKRNWLVKWYFDEWNRAVVVEAEDRFEAHEKGKALLVERDSLDDFWSKAGTYVVPLEAP